MKNSSIRNKLTRSYMSLILALVLLILTGFIATILVSTIPSMTPCNGKPGNGTEKPDSRIGAGCKGRG